MVTVTDDSTREDLALCLANLNEQAKFEGRRGYVGTRGQRYADLHASMNACLDGLEARPNS